MIQTGGPEAVANINSPCEIRIRAFNPYAHDPANRLLIGHRRHQTSGPVPAPTIPKAGMRIRAALQRYFAGVDFRWNWRKIDAGERTALAIRKRLATNCGMETLRASPRGESDASSSVGSYGDCHGRRDRGRAPWRAVQLNHEGFVRIARWSGLASH